MKKILLLTTCLLGTLVAADTSSLPSDPATKNTLSSGVTDFPRFSSDAPLQWHKESVVKQVDAWEKIHAAKRKIPGFSNTATNFPPVLSRITYMAGYVRTAIAGLEDREAAVDELMEKAESLLKQEKLTFQEAASLFDRLAMTSDTSIPLDKQKQSKWGFSEGEVERNLAFLCVPKGGLSIARFADECLSEFPLRYVVLPNHPLEGGPHGSDHSIYEFFNHDRGHANQGDAVIWSKLWPGLKRIKDLKGIFAPTGWWKSIEVLLFRYFHETSSSYNDCWTCQPPCPGHDLERDLETFAPFINRLGDMSKIYPFRKQESPSYLILSGAEGLKEYLIRNEIISDNNQFQEFSVRQTDEDFVLNVSLVEHPISTCGAEFHDNIETATKPVVTKLKIKGEEFSCAIRSGQLELAAFFDDPLYLLKYAGVTTLCNGSDLPEHVVPDNVFAVAERFNQLMDDAAKLLIHTVQKHASETPSVSEHPSTSSFKSTDRKDGKEK